MDEDFKDGDDELAGLDDEEEDDDPSSTATWSKDYTQQKTSQQQAQSSAVAVQQQASVRVPAASSLATHGLQLDDGGVDTSLWAWNQQHSVFARQQVMHHGVFMQLQSRDTDWMTEWGRMLYHHSDVEAGWKAHFEEGIRSIGFRKQGESTRVR